MMIPTYSDNFQKNNRLFIIGEADPFLARLLKRFAEKSGFKAKRAQTGDAVLDLARCEQPALIILEPELPGKLRGWEAAQTILHTSEINQIPIIFFSWLNEEDARNLVGQVIIHMQKPDLSYEAFTAALQAAGVMQPPVSLSH